MTSIVSTSFSRLWMNLRRRNLRKSMRIGIVLFQHDPQTDPPSHFVSKKLAETLCSERRNRTFTAMRISKKIIWLQVNEPISEIRRRHKTWTTVVRPIPKLLPPRRPENLLLQYPLAEQTSVLPSYPAFRRLCAEQR